MTEKRFELKWKDTGEVLYDNETGLEHGIYSPDYRFHVRDMMNEFDKKNKELKAENEQLKKENYELHKRLGDFEAFERYMKERTSKTSLEDIIGIVKTDEPTNSVELKKELYK